MKNVLGLFPLTGNGGIASWTKRFLLTFPNNRYNIIPVNVAPDESDSRTGFMFRAMTGMKALCRIRKDVLSVIQTNNIQIMHITTSGSLGTLRDYVVNQICRKHGIKTIMHCRYGSIPEDYSSKGFLGCLLRKTMHSFDQVWVLDSRSESALKTDPTMKDKVYLTPNSIEVPTTCDLSPKKYNKIAFVGNLIPSKGLFELVEAVVKYDGEIELSIAGPGPDVVVEKIKCLAGNDLDKRIKILGKLPNDKAVELIKSVDMIALPTYYSPEAFPISILEAMSRGKLVISCQRAAIKDMLTASDGTLCGILVREKSVEEIIKAIKWCQEHKNSADEICAKAYEKVTSSYRTDVVYDLYRNLYEKLC